MFEQDEVPRCFICNRRSRNLKPIMGATGNIVWHECIGKCQEEKKRRQRRIEE